MVKYYIRKKYTVYYILLTIIQCNQRLLNFNILKHNE
jgi:hypothetical protein